MPNALSASRFAFAVTWVAVFYFGVESRLAYAALACAAALTDFIDGRIARRIGAVTASGRWLDSASDVAFVLAALSCEAAAGSLPPYIPALIAISFAQYVIDSMVLTAREGGPVRSRLGHWGGIVNYALVLTLAFAPPPAYPGELVRRLAPIIALLYAAAIIERALQYRVRR